MHVPHELVTAALRRFHASSTTSGTSALRGEAVTALADAIGTPRLWVACQPIVSLQTGQPTGVEALVRVDDDVHPQLRSAPDIVGVAEASGLIDALGLDVLDRTLARLAAWRRLPGGTAWRAHVNVSPLQLHEERFVDDVLTLLRAHALPPGAVALEVTESAAIGADGTAQRILQTLESRGVELAIDDFGTGYASLDLLARIPARTVKLDRSFVAAIGGSSTPRGRAMVAEAVIGLGRSIGLRVVAEGIETEQQVALLRSWGCELGQGYHFARPVRPEQLAPVPLDQRPPQLDPGPHRLAEASLELAVAAAVVGLAGRAPRHRVEDTRAVVLSRILTEAVALTRDRGDTELVLAAVACQGAEVFEATQGEDPRIRELRDALAQPPQLRLDAPIGAFAAAAVTLHGAQLAGEDVDVAVDELLRDAGLEAEASHHLLRLVREWWTGAVPAGELVPGLLHTDDAHDLVRDAERRLRVAGSSTHRVRALLGMARIIGSSSDLVQTLDACAFEARRVLGVTTVSISRLDPDGPRLRTLVNVGDLRSDQHRHPGAEPYTLTDEAAALRRLEERSVRTGRGTDQPPGRTTTPWAAAPIVVDGAVWGELFCVTAANDPELTTADGPFVLAVASLIGVAVARAQDLTALQRLAHEDPLTGLANRRRLDDHGSRLLHESTGTPGPSVAMIDVNGLKEINDEFGHAAGDSLLRVVGDALRQAAAHADDALAVRIGGDEFCLITPGDQEELRELLADVQDDLAQRPPPRPRLSVGAAVGDADEHDLATLLARADAAQYDAKRTGAPLVVHGARRSPVRRSLEQEPSPGRSQAPLHVATALQRWIDALVLADDDPRLLLENLGDVLTAVLDLNRWILSEVTEDGDMIIRQAHLRRSGELDELAPALVDQHYHLDDYPLTTRSLDTGVPFAVDVDDPQGDVDEQAMLREVGARYVVGVPFTVGPQRWTLECFGDQYSVPSDLAARLIDALVGYRERPPLRSVGTAEPGPDGSERVAGTGA